MFFSEIMKEDSDIMGCISSRVRHLVQLHCKIALRKILKKYDKVHNSVSGVNFRGEIYKPKDEVFGNAGRITEPELLLKRSCRSCSRLTCFPQYNDPIKLLQTKKGRYGESANFFSLYCRSFGYETRLCEPPRDVEDYIHRSGRTGRAGNSGVAITLYEPRNSNISKLEREAGVKFEHIYAPQPADIAKAVGGDAAEAIIQVVDSVIPVFKSAVEELLNNSGLTPVELLAKALAKSIGYTEIKHMSLLSSMENHVTLHLEAGRPVYTPSLEKDYGMKYCPYEAGVDVFLSGYVFHLKILHERGLDLLNGQSESYQVKRVSSKVARKELRMLKLAARDVGALREAKDKLEKCVEELTWRLDFEKQLRVYFFIFLVSN
ncbi:unnamed protein product [Lactuca virosa]|uniref:RNA helicase n=1 Tax=Lactuca virosa TaxID=75947 RepID=A0AAU9M5W8_9ASTR|nr:unnamed protein product [Lactuca virosa]